MSPSSGFLKSLLKQTSKSVTQMTGEIVHRSVCLELLCRIGYSTDEAGVILHRHDVDDQLVFLMRASAQAIMTPNDPKTNLLSILAGLTPVDGNYVNKIARAYFLADEKGVPSSSQTPPSREDEIAISRSLGISFLRRMGSGTPESLIDSIDQSNSEDAKTSARHPEPKPVDPTPLRRNTSGPLPDPEPLTAGTSSSPLAGSHASGSSNGGHILD